MRSGRKTRDMQYRRKQPQLRKTSECKVLCNTSITWPSTVWHLPRGCEECGRSSPFLSGDLKPAMLGKPSPVRSSEAASLLQSFSSVLLEAIELVVQRELVSKLFLLAARWWSVTALWATRKSGPSKGTSSARPLSLSPPHPPTSMSSSQDWRPEEMRYALRALTWAPRCFRIHCCWVSVPRAGCSGAGRCLCAARSFLRSLRLYT